MTSILQFRIHLMGVTTGLSVLTRGIHSPDVRKRDGDRDRRMAEDRAGRARGPVPADAVPFAHGRSVPARGHPYSRSP